LTYRNTNIILCSPSGIQAGNTCRQSPSEGGNLTNMGQKISDSQVSGLKAFLESNSNLDRQFEKFQIFLWRFRDRFLLQDVHSSSGEGFTTLQVRLMRKANNGEVQAFGSPQEIFHTGVYVNARMLACKANAGCLAGIADGDNIPSRWFSIIERKCVL
jgi:hypothetical protein